MVDQEIVATGTIDNFFTSRCMKCLGDEDTADHDRDLVVAVVVVAVADQSHTEQNSHLRLTI